MNKTVKDNFGRLIYSEKIAKINGKKSVPETNNDWRKYPYDVGELHFPRDEGKHNYLL